MKSCKHFLSCKYRSNKTIDYVLTIDEDSFESSALENFNVIIL